MRHPRLRLNVILAALLVVCGPSIGAQNVQLKYHWAKGEEARYRVTQDQTTTMNGLPGGTMTIGTTVTTVIHMAVAELAADGAAAIHTRFDSLRIDAATPAGKVTIDSAQPTGQVDPALADARTMVASLVGETVTITMAANGAILKVEGMSALGAKIKSSLSANSPLGDSFDALLNDDSFKSTIGQGFAILPDKPVAPGGTWQTTLTVPGPLAMTTSNVFTLAGPGQGTDRNLTRITMTQQFQAAPGAVMGQVKITLHDGVGDGEILFDQRRGKLVHFVSHGTIPMMISSPGDASAAITGLTKSTVTMELLER